jgi:hypothetical protein
MPTAPSQDLHNAIFDLLLAGRTFQDIAQVLGLEVLELAAAVDLPRLAEFAANARKLQQTCDEFSASHARSKAVKGLGFIIENRLGSPETVRRAATALIRGTAPPRPRRACGPAVAAAVQFLQETLADGPRPATQVQQLASEHGIAPRTLRRARSQLGVLMLRRGFGAGAVSVWRLPDPSLDASAHRWPIGGHISPGHLCPPTPVSEQNEGRPARAVPGGSLPDRRGFQRHPDDPPGRALIHAMAPSGNHDVEACNGKSLKSHPLGDRP